MHKNKITQRAYGSQLQESSEEREKLFKKLLDHIAQGFSLESFPECSEKVLKKMFECFPIEFCQEEMDVALKKGRHFWEKVGKDQSLGKCLGNSSSWKFNMSAKYGWTDKVDVRAEHTGAVAVQVVSYAASCESAEGGQGDGNHRS